MLVIGVESKKGVAILWLAAIFSIILFLAQSQIANAECSSGTNGLATTKCESYATEGKCPAHCCGWDDTNNICYKLSCSGITDSSCTICGCTPTTTTSGGATPTTSTTTTTTLPLLGCFCAGTQVLCSLCCGTNFVNCDTKAKCETCKGSWLGGIGGSTCTETDEGKDPYKPGTVTGNSGGRDYSYFDHCDGQTLHEQYCNSDNEPKEEIKLCPAFCNQPDGNKPDYCIECKDNAAEDLDWGNDPGVLGTLRYVTFSGAADKWGIAKILNDTCALPSTIIEGQQTIPPGKIATILPSLYQPAPCQGLLQGICVKDESGGFAQYKPKFENRLCPAGGTEYGCKAGICFDELDITGLGDGCQWKAKRCAPGSDTQWQRCTHYADLGKTTQCESCSIDCADPKFSCYKDGTKLNQPTDWDKCWLKQHCNANGLPCTPVTRLSWGSQAACEAINPFCDDNWPAPYYRVVGNIGGKDISVGEIEGTPCHACDFNQQSCILCNGDWVTPTSAAGSTEKVVGGCCDSNFYDDIEITGGTWRKYPDCAKAVGSKICDAKDITGEAPSYAKYIECWQQGWPDGSCWPLAPAAKLNDGGDWQDGSANPLRKLDCDGMTYLYDNVKWHKAEGNCTEVNATGKMYLDYMNSSWAICDSTFYYKAINCTTGSTKTEYFCTQDGWKTDVTTRCTPDKSKCDYCSRSAMCLLHPESPTDEPPMPRCVKIGEYDNDNYCLNGTWSTRTALVASQLLNFAKDKDAYRIFCDIPEKALNNYEELLSPGDIGPWLSGVNKVCTLEYKSGSQVRRAVGTSLKKDYFLNTESYGFLQGVLKLPADYCQNAIKNEDKFYQCTGQQVWWNNKTQIVIYSADIGGIGLQPNIITDFVAKFKELLYDPVTYIINLIKAAFGGQPLQMDKYVKELTDFDRFYAAKQGDKKVTGFIRDEADCTSDNICGKYVAVDFENVNEDICGFISAWDNYDGIGDGNPTQAEIYCTKKDKYYHVVSHADQGGEFAIVEAVWTDLTSELRVK